ncbi:MAG: hypothetical protein KA436_01740 [Oligoflexales bacterium]|nr:hypothetical protein [Oligoflexales bacterium]
MSLKLDDMETFRIDEAEIYAFRVFDIGAEINLSLAAKTLEERKKMPYGLKRPTRSILMTETPLVVNLESWVETIKEAHYEVQSSAKLWSFGAVSIQVTLKLISSYTLDELCEIGHVLEKDNSFHEKVVEQTKKLISILGDSIEKPNLWPQHEDYLIFNIRSWKGESADFRANFISDSTFSDKFTALILGERPQKFSAQTKQSMETGIYQYTNNDLVMIHWNGALIYDQDGALDITLLIEFALCTVLEMRYYDEKLDRQLTRLYEKIVSKKPGIFSNPYKELSEDAALQYIEVSKIIDKIGNAFKALGDYYYATLFRVTMQKFYVQDWKKNVDEKLSSLAEVSILFQGEINERRNQFMEIIIIVLIAFEVLPFLIKYVFFS